MSGIARPASSVIFSARDLDDLQRRDSPLFPDGASAFVVEEQEFYTLDTASTFAVYSPLIVRRGLGTGRWFRRSKQYVVANYTLWCQAGDYGAAGFTPGQLLTTGTRDPDIALDMRSVIPAPGTQQSIVPDTLGNLWFIVNTEFATITASKYLLKDCTQSGVVTPEFTIVVPQSVSSETGIAAFDRYNGLWVANGGHGAGGVSSLVRYGTRAYGVADGVPGLSISVGGSTSYSNQQDAVFDGQGNMWCSVARSGPDPGGYLGGIFMFSAAQLQAGGSQTPAVAWSGSNLDGPSLASTAGLAIAPNGYIWASDVSAAQDSNRLRAWAPTHASGNPVPDVVLTCDTFSAPYGITFDTAGNLWVSNGYSNTIQRIPAASLVTSGAVTADIIVTTKTIELESKISFAQNPDRSGLLPSGF